MVFERAFQKDNRCYQMCKCYKCGTVAQCTPSFDFYSKFEGGFLECETCFRQALGVEMFNAKDGKLVKRPLPNDDEFPEVINER